jgi:ABC-type multidrug transport system fused ATPase/permease subunit
VSARWSRAGVPGRYLLAEWPAAAALAALSLLSAGLAALLPVLLAPILDLALATDLTRPAEGSRLGLRTLGVTVIDALGLRPTPGAFGLMIVLGGIWVAVGVLHGLVEYGAYMLTQWIRVRARAALQLDVLRHVLGLSLGFFSRERAGELLARLQSDTRLATSGIETLSRALLTAPVLIVFYGVLLVATSLRMVAVAAAAALLHALLTRALRGRIRRLTGARLEALGRLTARAQETFLAIRVVKSFGAERHERHRFDGAVAGAMDTARRLGAWRGVDEPARSALNTVVEAAVLAVAVWELVAGRLSAPALVLFLYVMRAFVAQIAPLGTAWMQWYVMDAAAVRLRALLAVPPAVVDGGEPVHGFHDRLATHAVSVDKGGTRVLDAVSLEIRRGECVAIVGPSGVGKSTLGDLLLRLCDPVSGTVTLDGRDVRTLRIADYRKLFGVVPQETLLFNASVRDNITAGRDLSDEEIEAVARVAAAHDFIVALPHGYDTPVGDRGVRLSGGQRQRIALARALAGRPAILLLDEATSALDSESDRLVRESIERIVAWTTSIVIAHRLSTVLRADRIVVLAGGRVEATGHHHELLARSPTYRRLYHVDAATGTAER